MEETIFGVFVGVLLGVLVTVSMKSNIDTETACRLRHTELEAYEKCVSTTEYDQTVRVLKSELAEHNNVTQKP